MKSCDSDDWHQRRISEYDVAYTFGKYTLFPKNAAERINIENNAVLNVLNQPTDTLYVRSVAYKHARRAE